MSANLNSADAARCRFSQTQWTEIIDRAADPSSAAVDEALNRLCQGYWFPVYAFIRSQRVDSDRAKDLTQGFFIHFLERKLVRKVDREKGRFRTFLLACLRNYLTDEARREGAQKRGGKMVVVPIDEDDAEERYGALPATDPAPEVLFDKMWAASVIEQARQNLEHDYERRGRGKMFRAMQGCLNGSLLPSDYPQRAADLGMSKGTFETNLCRLREAFGVKVRAAVSETVNADEVADEIKYLMAAWAAHLNDIP